MGDVNNGMMGRAKWCLRIGHTGCQTVQKIRHGCFVVRFHKERVNEDFNRIGTICRDVAVDLVPTL